MTPLRWAHQNLLYAERGDEVAALYRLPPVSYPFLTTRDKLGELGRYARLAAAVEADLSLWRVNRAYPAGDYSADVAPLGYARFQDERAWHDLLAQHESHLEQFSADVPEVYVAVSVKQSRAASFGGSFLRGWDRTRLRLYDLLGLGSGQPISRRTLEAHLTAEERIAGLIARVCPGSTRATTEQLQWLFRRAPSRGVAEPELDPYWRGDDALYYEPEGEGARYEPESGLFLRLETAAVYEEARALVVESEECRSYQAMLVLGALPDAPVFPGALAELLHAPLNAVDFPVDACVHLRYIPNREARGQVKRKIMDADNVAAEESGGRHGATWASEDRQTLARELDEELAREGHPPLLRATISLALGAPSRQQLEERIDTLRARYHPVQLHRPFGLQPTLYEEHLPRVGSGLREDGYAEVLTIEQFGALMPTATGHVGSERGLYIGYTTTGGRRPVKFDPFEAARLNRAPSILAAGRLGSGKTLFSMLVAYLAQRMGAIVATVDPKPDHTLYEAAELDGLVDVIDVTAGEATRGLLDPLRVAGKHLREDLAVSYFTDILRDCPAAWELEIQRAVQDVIQRGRNSSLAMLEALEQSSDEDARAAGAALRLRSNSGLGALAFGDVGQHSDIAAAPITTIRTSGLQLPDASSPRGQEMPHVERMSLATLKLVAHYALQLVESARGERGKLLVIDEAWSLLASTEGKALINRINRMGRSMDATLILATQTLGDVGDLEKLVGTRLIFGLETHDEAKAALRLLGLDPGDQTMIERIRSYRAGQCLMRDIHNRIGELQVDFVFDDLLRALDTSPDATAARFQRDAGSQNGRPHADDERDSESDDQREPRPSELQDDDAQLRP